MIRIKDVVTIFPKSNIQANDYEQGNVPFFTSSQTIKKFCSSAIYPKDSIIMGTGGQASVNFSSFPFSASTDCFSFQVKNNPLLTKYIFYYLYSKLSEIDSISFRGIGIRHLQKDQILNTHINESLASNKLVNFLDNKVYEINSMIEIEKQQIEKLKEYKQAVITEAVTKGVDKNVPMKDSGVEWIGPIPKNWDIIRIKDVFSLSNEKTTEFNLENVNLLSLYTDKGVIQHSDLIETTGNKAVTSEGYKIVKRNDIVVNIILCWMGAIGMSNYDGVTSPAYDIYNPKDTVNSKYYHYLFRTKYFSGECYRYGKGIMLMRWRTYSDKFLSIYIPFPSIYVQKRIVDYLEEKSTYIENLLNIKQQKIRKLEEYKKSLIYEFVTGKKEIT